MWRQVVSRISAKRQLFRLKVLVMREGYVCIYRLRSSHNATMGLCRNKVFGRPSEELRAGNCIKPVRNKATMLARLGPVVSNSLMSVVRCFTVFLVLCTALVAAQVTQHPTVDITPIPMEKLNPRLTGMALTNGLR